MTCHTVVLQRAPLLVDELDYGHDEGADLYWAYVDEDLLSNMAYKARVQVFEADRKVLEGHGRPLKLLDYTAEWYTIVAILEGHITPKVFGWDAWGRRLNGRV